jgi:RNA polymerase sigma-70 factor (ECF subfamily)
MRTDRDATEAADAADSFLELGGSVVHRSSRMDPERERALVRLVPSDGRAFGELYDFYVPRIYGFVFGRLRERGVTEDVTATVFERALGALRSGRFRNDSFGGWLYRVAANAVIDHVRAGRHLAAEDDLDAMDPAPDMLVGAIDRDELRRAMSRISDTHRRVLALRFFDDLDPGEASAVLGCSRRTFAVKLHRALGALRAAMTAERYDGMEASDVA